MPAMVAGVTSNGGADIDSITVTDIINTDGKTYAPVTNVTIAVTEGDAKHFNDGKVMLPLKPVSLEASKAPPLRLLLNRTLMVFILRPVPLQ